MYDMELKSKLVIKNLSKAIEDPNNILTKELLKQFFYVPGDTNSYLYAIIKQNFKGKKKEKIEALKIFDDVLKNTIKTDIYMELNKNDDIPFLLVQLSINCQSEELSRSTIELFYLIGSQPKLIKNTLYEVELISDDSQENYKFIYDIASRLNDLSDSCEKWFVNPNSNEQIEIHAILDKLTQTLLSKDNNFNSNKIDK